MFAIRSVSLILPFMLCLNSIAQEPMPDTFEAVQTLCHEDAVYLVYKGGLLKAKTSASSVQSRQKELEWVARACDDSATPPVLHDITVNYMEHWHTMVVSYVKETSPAQRCYHVLVRCGGFWFKTGSLCFPATQDPVDQYEYYCGRICFWDRRMQEIPYGTWPLPENALNAIQTDTPTALHPYIGDALRPFLISHAALCGASACMEALLTHEMRLLKPAETAQLRAFTAVTKGDAELLRQCVAVPGFDVNAPLVRLGSMWSDSINLLNWALLKHQPECVRILLTQPGIAPNGNNSLSSPLHVAISHKDAEMVRLLLACDGIDVNCRSSMGYHGYRTPLHDAAANGLTEIVRLLLATPGIDIHARDKGGDTALDLAEKNGHAPCAELIRAHHAPAP